MASSCSTGALNPPFGFCSIPARTPGVLGLFDQGDPNFTTRLGDTPGTLGFNDWACPTLPWLSIDLTRGGICRDHDGTPLAAGGTGLDTELTRQEASTLSMSDKAMDLLREIEALHLMPYDDQTSKDITAWVAGATIGYGHLIAKAEWDTYKAGITKIEADALFKKDLDPFVTRVRNAITTKIAQQEFDALVILAFNIGPTFSSSSVVKLVNDPKAVTTYASLEEAWKAWNKSQGKVMKGLDNRRQCEWDIYSKGVYKRW